MLTKSKEKIEKKIFTSLKCRFLAFASLVSWHTDDELRNHLRRRKLFLRYYVSFLQRSGSRYNQVKIAHISMVEKFFIAMTMTT